MKKISILSTSALLLVSLSIHPSLIFAEDNQHTSEIKTSISEQSGTDKEHSVDTSTQYSPDKAGQSQPQIEEKKTTTALVNEQEVQVEAPKKATKEEADRTQAPKEEFQEGESDANILRSSEVILMYRLYNPNSGEHFYTGNPTERDKVKRAGWRYEGIGWNAPNNGSPVYRLYNPNAGDHHYTMNTHERDNLKKKGWRYEGISWYSDNSKRVAVYRAYNRNARAGSHNYTNNYNEQKNLMNHGWRDEGIAWYAASGATPNNNDYRLLGVKNYNQYASGAPSGCEGAALLQALQYKGKITNWGLVQFLNTIPKSPNGNPNSGFVGSPFVENSWTYSAIYPAPLTSWGQRYGNVQNMSGSSIESLINEVKNGNPVVSWVTINFQPIRWGNWSFGVAANNNHAVTLDGYNRTSHQVHVSDSISGTYWLNIDVFNNIYSARKYAVVVR